MVAATTLTTPSTMLEAINTLMRMARLSAVQTMDGVGRSVDASGAKSALDDVSREVLGRGWQFNTEREYVLMPDTDGLIYLPVNAIKATRAKYQYSQRRLYVRGRKLYDNEKHTFAIGEEALVDMVVALPFEDLPEAIKRLVVATAAYRWCIPKLPSGTTFQITQSFLQDCLIRAEQDEVDELSDETLKDTSPHFARMARRRS